MTFATMLRATWLSTCSSISTALLLMRRWVYLKSYRLPSTLTTLHLYPGKLSIYTILCCLSITLTLSLRYPGPSFWGTSPFHWSWLWSNILSIQRERISSRFSIRKNTKSRHLFGGHPWERPFSQDSMKTTAKQEPSGYSMLKVKETFCQNSALPW